MAEEEILEDEAEDDPVPAPRPQHVPVPGGGFVERSWAVQDRVSKRWDSLSKGRIARVLRMARKPEPEEFRQSAMIVLVGIAVIGALGFFTYLFMSWLLKAITPA